MPWIGSLSRSSMCCFVVVFFLMPFEAFLGYCLSWSLGLLLPSTQTSDPALIHIWGCSSHCDGVPQHHSLPLGSRRSQDKSVYWTVICPEVLLWEVWRVLAWHSCEVAMPQCSLSADSPDSSPLKLWLRIVILLAMTKYFSVLVCFADAFSSSTRTSVPSSEIYSYI